MNNKDFNEIINGVRGQGSKKAGEDYLKKNLTPSQSKRLQEVLSDKTAVEQLLSTPQAQELLRMFTEDKNG